MKRDIRGKEQDVLLNETQAAQILGFTIRALQAWRSRREGPTFVRISSRAIRYRHDDVMKVSDLSGQVDYAGRSASKSSTVRQ